jgi:hypothetical protein
MSASDVDSLTCYRTPSHFARKYGTHPNTFIRWCRDGVLFSDGTRRRPEHVRTPGGYRATEGDVQEFLETVKADRERSDCASPPPPKPDRHSQRLAKARRTLAAQGF